MAILNHKARKIKTHSTRAQANKVANIDRCPGCLGFPGNIRALALYVHKKTGRMFGYALCDKCATRLRLNPQAIIANVEGYFGEEIVEMDAESVESAR